MTEQEAVDTLQKKMDEAYKLGCEHTANELNARLLERQIAFNEADKRRVARIQELEDQLRLKEVEIEKWKKACDDEIMYG